MKNLGLFLGVLMMITACNHQEFDVRDQDFNYNWLFTINLEDEAYEPEYDDSGWRSSYEYSYCNK